jgi:hypothetical protein
MVFSARSHTWRETLSADSKPFPDHRNKSLARASSEIEMKKNISLIVLTVACLAFGIIETNTTSAGMPVPCTANPVVNTSVDGATDSLRDAIGKACTGSTITFDMGSGGVTNPISLMRSELFIDKKSINAESDSRASSTAPLTSARSKSATPSVRPPALGKARPSTRCSRPNCKRQSRSREFLQMASRSPLPLSAAERAALSRTILRP